MKLVDNIRLAGVKLSVKTTIIDHHGVLTLKDMEVYPLKTHEDLTLLLKDNAIMLLKKEVAEKHG